MLALLVSPAGASRALGAPPPRTTAGTPTAAPGGAAGTDLPVTLASGRGYVLFRPSRPAAVPRLVVALHWYGSSGPEMESRTDLDTTAGATGSYVAYPTAASGTWNAGTCCGTASTTGTDDVAFLDEVIADAQARGRVAAGKVVMTGFSNGGMMAYRYACARPTSLAMIVPVGATNVAGCPAAVSLVALHGALDETVPWAGAAVTPSWLGGSFPAVSSVVGGAAWANGCTGGFATTVQPGLVQYTAQSCPAGRVVTVFLVAAMAHVWPVGAADRSLYAGADATQLLWSVAFYAWSLG